MEKGGKTLRVSLRGLQAACFKLFSGSAQQQEYLKASCLQPPDPPWQPRKRVNEQRQTLPTKEEMLYLLFTHLQGPCAIQN